MSKADKIKSVFITMVLLTGATTLVFLSLKPKAPVCKICHCHKTLCATSCGEENMCLLRCERLCQKRSDSKPDPNKFPGGAQ